MMTHCRSARLIGAALPLLARPIAHEPMEARWPRVVDGIVYIDVMSPSTPAAQAGG